MITRRALLKLAGAGLLAGVAAATYPVVEAIGAPRITRYPLTPRHWTPASACGSPSSPISMPVSRG